MFRYTSQADRESMSSSQILQISSQAIEHNSHEPKLWLEIDYEPQSQPNQSHGPNIKEPRTQPTSVTSWQQLEHINDVVEKLVYPLELGDEYD